MEGLHPARMEPFFVGEMPMHRYGLVAILAAATLMSACSRTDNESGPGGVTVSEAKALDDAAEMLESRDAAPAVEQSAADKTEQTDK